MTRYLTGAVLLTALLFSLPAAPSGEACLPEKPGWYEADGQATEADRVLHAASAQQVVLLGERHDSGAHHRWQLAILKALHKRRADIALALEMFPRRVQPVLHAWSAGVLDEATFLRRSEWDDVWGVDAELYMDIFRYARAHNIPMYALNVDAELTRTIGRDGLDAVPPGQREGVSEPAEAERDYTEWLEGIHARHAHARDENTAGNFIDAQLFWDRAFAEGLVRARREHPEALVVGLIGSAHLRHGFGVPHQLRELGLDEHVTLLPWDRDSDCRHLQPGVADAIYMIGGEGDGPADRSR